MRSVLRRLFDNPLYVVGGIGLVGFLIDMCVKPISNAGLILLGLASSPWLTKLIKSAKVAGVELEMAPPAPREATGARLAEEIGSQPVDQLPASAPSGASEGAQAHPAAPITGTGGNLYAPSDRLALAYLAEGLVLQELQREVGGLLQRNVDIGTHGNARQLDGLIVASDATIAVEIKLFIGRPPVKAIITQLHERLEFVPFELRKRGYTNPRVVIAIITYDDSSEYTELFEALSNPRIQVRHFNFNELLSKYGFSGAEIKQGSARRRGN